ncbi:MAG: hypothetical protein ACREXY_02685, partial [Gammaproteobacteria bacterium]
NEINSGMRDDNSPLKGTRGMSSHVARGGLRTAHGFNKAASKTDRSGQFSEQYAPAREYLVEALVDADPTVPDGKVLKSAGRPLLVINEFRDQYAHAREEFMQKYARPRVYLYLDDVAQDDRRASFPRRRGRVRADQVDVFGKVAGSSNGQSS